MNQLNNSCARNHRDRSHTLKFLLLCCFTITTFSTRSVLAAGQPAGPAVLMLISDAKDGMDQIGLTYPSVIQQTQAMRDLQALETATGWKAENIRITDAPPPLQGATTKMTSVEFTCKNAIAPQNHYLTLEPVVTALRAYSHVRLIYFIGDTYDFQGLREYHDKYVSIQLDQHGLTFAYDIHILDPTFQKLNLPVYQAPVAQMHTAATGNGKTTQSHRVHPWQVLLVTVIAAVAGVTVYAVMCRNA